MPNILEQAKTFVNKLSKNQKWILGGLSIVVIVGIIALIIALYEPPETTSLFNNLESSDASKIIEYLKSNNIDYELKDNATTIIVPKDRRDEIRMAVANQGLIQDSYVGYELFDKTNLGMSEYVQQLNGRRALEGELQRTIKSMKEIKDVKVHLVIPKKTLFKNDEKPPTAAITLKFSNGHSLSKMSIEGIQNIVASSVEGMTPDKVVVTDNYGRIISEDIPDNSTLAGITSSQFKQQKQLENYLSDKVQSLLDPAFGFGNSKVKLNTEIDFDQLEVNKRDWDPERQVERSEQTFTDNYNNIDTSFVPGTNEQIGKSNEIRNYEITNADSHFVKGIGAIKRLTITAIVNEKIEIHKTPQGLDTVVSIPRNEEELNKIADAIKNSVGYNEQRGDQVNVLCVPFVEILADRITEVNEYNHQNSIQWWEKENYQKLLLLLLTLLITSIVMFKIIHAKFAKDKIHIALGLPEKLEKPVLEKFDSNLLELPQEEKILDEDEEDYYEDEEVLEPLLDSEVAVEEIMEDMDENFDEMEIEDEDMLMLPDELPEQILLEDNLLNEMDIFGLNDEEYIPEQVMETSESLLDRARAALVQEQSVLEEVSEAQLIKMELRDKVNAFVIDAPDLAVRLFRVFYNQDNAF
jgi:flagellar M-ring protein FliF